MPIYGSPTPCEAFKPAVRQVGLVVCDGFSLLDVRMVIEVLRTSEEIGKADRGNGDNLAKIFRRKWSISPTEYRSRQRREKCVSAGVSEQGGGTDVIPGMMSI
ncbi:MAG: hypothetical protein EPN70_06410 [Paraburkholderia sp.]|uniref:hypothetical protein n=1 Tax=Paraburkholderia sp. TaxID=1926495 RepID=UPI00121FF245|nr:hypothetical protein [Paraburkholderia sp.]TAM06241.1 MAG: hypothetical protein EPN70_06410 [Paraburkholderia sp.]